MYKTFNKVMCKDCVYCTRDDENVPIHKCRKNTPTLSQTINGLAAWPEVSLKTGWCGEGVAKTPVYSSVCKQ